MIFSLFILYKLYENILNLHNFLTLISFLLISTTIIPYNIQNTLNRIKNKKKFNKVINNTYYYM